MDQAIAYETVKHFVIYTAFFMIIILECSMIGYTLSEAIYFVVKKVRKHLAKKHPSEDSVEETSEK